MGKKWKYVLTSVYKDVGGIQVLCSELCQVKFVHIPRCRRERVRLGTFRGFGTELARLGTFKKNLKKMLLFYSKRAKTKAIVTR